MAKMNISPSDLCGSCNVVEDVSHIIFKCSRFDSVRNDYPSIMKYSHLEDFVKGEGTDNVFVLTAFLKKAGCNL